MRVRVVCVVLSLALCTVVVAGADASDAPRAPGAQREAPTMMDVSAALEMAREKIAWLREGFMFSVMHAFRGVVEFASELMGISHEAAFYSVAAGSIGALFLFFTAISGSSNSSRAVKGSGGDGGELRVSALTIFPIKSCRGISVSSAKVEEDGFRFDRKWMLVDAATGRFVTQRQFPKLALVQPIIGSKDMHVSAPDMMNVLRIPLSGPRHKTTREVSVWDDTVEGIDEGKKAAKWFSTYLKKEVVLVRQNSKRPIDKRYSHKSGSKGVTLADGFPFLLLGERSVKALNERSGNHVTIDRFRANIIVDRSKAYAEDNWKELTIGAVEMFGTKRCDRCKLTTVDPVSGTFDMNGEPLASLRKYRTGGTATGNRGEAGVPSKVYMGLNLVQSRKSIGKVIRVGDPVIVRK